MRFLLDANLSPLLVPRLEAAGYETAHVADLGLLTASDLVILERAEKDGHVLVTAHSDFPMLVALRRSSSPSVLLLRGVAEFSMDRHLDLLVTNLP